MKKKCNIKESFIGLVFLAGRSIFERGRWGVEIIVLALSFCRFIENYMETVKWDYDTLNY